MSTAGEPAGPGRTTGWHEALAGVSPRSVPRRHRPPSVPADAHRPLDVDGCPSGTGVGDLLVRMVDPLAAAFAVRQLVRDVSAGVLLGTDGRVGPLPGLRDDALLVTGGALLDVVRARSSGGRVPESFLWPRAGRDGRPELVRVTHAVPSEPSATVRCGVVLLSPPGGLRGLTRRELDVLGHLVEGASNEQIARALVVTPRTVATHLEHLLAKLSSPSRTHAAVLAQREGLFVPPVRAAPGRH